MFKVKYEYFDNAETDFIGVEITLPNGIIYTNFHPDNFDDKFYSNHTEEMIFPSEQIFLSFVEMNRNYQLKTWKMGKKENVEFWDNLEDATETYLINLLRWVNTYHPTIEIETIKEVLEKAVELLKEEFNVEFPYVEEDY